MSKPSSRPTPEQLARYATGFNESATLRHWNCRISFPNSERVQADLEVQEAHRGGLGAQAVNGGVLSALFDLVIGSAPALLDTTRRSATMQLSMNFMKPTQGNRVRAEAWIDSHGKSTLFASALIRDESGEVTARCQGVVKLSNQTWASGESPAVN